MEPPGAGARPYHLGLPAGGKRVEPPVLLVAVVWWDDSVGVVVGVVAEGGELGLGGGGEVGRGHHEVQVDCVVILGEKAARALVAVLDGVERGVARLGGSGFGLQSSGVGVWGLGGVLLTGPLSTGGLLGIKDGRSPPIFCHVRHAVGGPSGGVIGCIVGDAAFGEVLKDLLGEFCAGACRAKNSGVADMRVLGGVGCSMAAGPRGE